MKKVVVLTTLLIMFLVAIVPGRANAHDDAAWIQNGKYQTANKQSCCGIGDCKPENLTVVQATDTTITVADKGLTGSPRATTLIKYKGWYPSIDGEIWACRRANGTSRPVCVFFPEGGG